MKKIALATLSLLALCACENASTSSNSPTQELRIVTAPTGANCAIDIDKVTVDRVKGTPATAIVDKKGKDLLIRCLKTGYSQASLTVKPNADGSYESPVMLNLKKKK